MDRVSRSRLRLFKRHDSIYPPLFQVTDELIAGTIFSHTGYSSPLAGRIEALASLTVLYESIDRTQTN